MRITSIEWEEGREDDLGELVFEKVHLHDSTYWYRCYTPHGILEVVVEEDSDEE